MIVVPARARLARRGVVVAMALALGAYLATRPVGVPDSQVPGQAAAAQAGERSAGFVLTGAALDPLAVGSTAPELLAESDAAIGAASLDGRPIRLGDLRGRPVWLVFWATWCPPCREEFPLMSAVATSAAARASGLEVIPISTGEPAADVQAWTAAVDVPGRVGLDPTGLVADRFRVVGLPTHYFIGPDGTILARYFGPMTREAMTARVEALIGSEG